jgi:hypothetical protein
MPPITNGPNTATPAQTKAAKSQEKNEKLGVILHSAT